ncbi:MAG: hypothetical protein Q9159_006704 [Coniocarpon cinnabarinum]
MPYYDLNVPWTPDNPAETQRTLVFLKELGYNIVALTHTISGTKLPNDLSCPIPRPLPFDTSHNLHTLTRLNLPLTSNAVNHRLSALQACYDLLALRPTNQKTLEQACRDLECDIISLDLTVPFPFSLRAKTVKQAVDRGIGIEVCYAPAVVASDAVVRRNVIANATSLIRATGGKGILLSSEARRASGCRGPADVVNIAAVWGLNPDRGREALANMPRIVVATATLKRESYRGVVRIVDGGEKPVVRQGHDKPKAEGSSGKKRKADAVTDDVQNNDKNEEQMMPKPLSKREQKRRKRAEEQAKRTERLEGSVD